MASFEELQALAQAIGRNQTKDLDFIGATRRRDTLFNRFYEGLLDGTFQDDQEARQVLYGDKNLQTAYEKLKARLYTKLKNTLIIINEGHTPIASYQNAYFNCHKNLAVVRTMLGKHLRPTAIALSKRTLKTAQKFEITEVALEMARVLRHHVGTIQGDVSAFHKYDQLVEKYLAIYQAELLVEKHYSYLMSHHVNSISSNYDFLEYSSESINELQKIRQYIHSPRFDFLFFLSLIIHFEIRQDYHKVIDSCKEALSFFEKKKTVNNNVLYNFHLRLAASYIILGKYNLAGEEVKICLQLQPIGSINWYSALNLHLTLAFHTQQYAMAYQIYQEASNHVYFQKQYTHFSETWRIHEAFIHYFIATGKIKPAAEDRRRPFRLARFLNEVPVFSKDKRGANINILLIQVLFLLHQRKYDVLIDRMEALTAYVHRYLRRDDTFRSNCFIKMLLQLPAGRFTRAGVERRADKYWKKLQSMPLAQSNQSTDLEVVPYETLWSLVLESLPPK